MTTTELAVGSKSMPFLADHGFHGMVVLPGAFYVAEALRLSPGNLCPAAVRNVRFLSPAIISEEDLRILATVRETSDGNRECEFSQVDGDSSLIFASLEIGPDFRTGELAPPPPRFSVEAFKRAAEGPLDGKEFYERLRQNGNFYGPRFQIVQEIWRCENRAMGRLSMAGHEPARSPLHPVLLDACTQLLSAPVVEKGKAFVLKSIAALHIHEADLPETVWAVTELQTATESGFAGEIRVFDESGKPCLHFAGVDFAFLDSVEEKGRDGVSIKLCVASTFTAEPLEDSLAFWGAQLEMPVHVAFAPYNQIFQELLDPGSLFHKNADGVNVILLNLPDWADAPGEAVFDRARADRALKDFPRYALPNGLEIAHLNQHETDYVFKEIFEDKSYLKHGIRLHDGDTVIDIGANIGLFSLFAGSVCRAPKIYAFEPSPAAFARLKANGEAYLENFRAFNCGVSDRRKMARFTAYEKSSVFSGFFSDEAEDAAAIQAVVRNMLGGENADETDVDDLTADRLRHTDHECELLSVSDIIRENGIEKIDLLKIDAEKSEWDILSGIEESHWEIIKQIVIELHDRTGAAAERVGQLLTGKGFSCAVEQEKLLEDSGLFNVYATRSGEQRSGSNNADAAGTKLDRNVDEFCDALSAFMDRSTSPMILCVAPSEGTSFAEVERKLSERTSQIRNVQWIGSDSILARYPVEHRHDAQSHGLAHIPYTPEGYASLGTALFRHLFNSHSKPYKVIALDCDNTLWQGECGEDGPLGVKVTEAHRYLQKFIAGQMQAGVLICLCSRNNENDVCAVFEQHPDMLLKRADLAAWQINWGKKSANLQSLSEKLGLGLDGFIFIDDNPVECAEVKARFPSVLTLTLPRDHARIPSFLDNVWAFDHSTVTDEDRRRTNFYRENRDRERLRGQSLSLRDFLAGLELRVEIHPPSAEQIARVSQLTFRTNQFNLTTIRRSEEEIAALLNEKNVRCLVASVSDRFGDYGMVGVLIHRVEEGLCKVDTFLLSCRALGKGVEHRILSELGRRAIADGFEVIEMNCHPTEKNRPALDFITAIGAGYETDGGGGPSFRFPAEFLARLSYDPESAPADESHHPKPVAPRRIGAANLSDRLQKIAGELHDATAISSAIIRGRITKKPQDTIDYAGPGSDTESALAGIWERILGRARVGMTENFFEAGGTSLKAVLVVAAVRKELKKALSIVALFECPTIKLLAARLDNDASPHAQKIEAATAITRGQLRRSRALKRSSR